MGGKKIVIDEFHRLPDEFLDFLHSSGVKGELILITSTLWLAKNLLGRGSPIIGLVSPIRIGLIDEAEILLHLSRELEGRELVESSVYLREPFLIPFVPRCSFSLIYFHSSHLGAFSSPTPSLVALLPLERVHWASGPTARAPRELS